MWNKTRVPQQESVAVDWFVSFHFDTIQWVVCKRIESIGIHQASRLYRTVLCDVIKNKNGQNRAGLGRMSPLTAKPIGSRLVLLLLYVAQNSLYTLLCSIKFVKCRKEQQPSLASTSSIHDALIRFHTIGSPSLLLYTTHTCTHIYALHRPWMPL